MGGVVDKPRHKQGGRCDGGKDGKEKDRKVCISASGCVTHVVFNDMHPALLVSLCLCICHSQRGRHVPHGHWADTSLKGSTRGGGGVLPPLAITNKQGAGPTRLH